jgi:hypothetical protein
MRVDASLVNLPTLSFSPMSASAGRVVDSSDSDNLIRDGISLVIDSVNKSQEYKYWKTEPAALRGLFALEVHIERGDHNGIERHKQKIRELEAEVLKREQTLEKENRIERPVEKESLKYRCKYKPNLEYDVMQAKLDLRLRKGLVTRGYNGNKPAFYHYLYIIHLNNEGKPTLIASLDSHTQKWVNSIDSYEKYIRALVDDEGRDPGRGEAFMVDTDEKASSLYSDEVDYYCRIFDKTEEGKQSGDRAYYEFKTSFLFTYSLTWTRRETFKIEPYEIQHNGQHVWMGTDMARIDILLYKIKRIGHRRLHLYGRIRELKENDKRIIDEFNLLTKENDSHVFWLDIYQESAKLNDFKPFLDVAVQHLTDIDFTEPVALQVASTVSEQYWRTVIIEKWNSLALGWQCDVKGDFTHLYSNQLEDPGRLLGSVEPIERQRKLLQYSHMNTFNGFRLSTHNQQCVIYDLYILQVIHGKPTILAKMTKNENYNFGDPIPNLHTWENINVRQTPNNRKVWENYSAFCGKTIQVEGGQWQFDYSFAIGEHALDSPALLYGKTGYLPQLIIHRDASHAPVVALPLVKKNAYAVLQKWARDPKLLLQVLKVEQVEDIELGRFINRFSSFHDPRNNMVMSKDEALSAFRLYIEQYIDTVGAVSTRDDFSAAALQETMARWRWW